MKQKKIRKSIKKRKTIATAAIAVIGIPLVLFLGFYALGTGKYLLISLIVLICAMLPFLFLFEKRKPQARELVVLSVMTALSVIGNLAFFMISPFQAGTAMVIITGIAFGPEAGFLCGALARFVCNFFSGQGIWTPFQMFAWGLVGCLAGFVFQRTVKEGKKRFSFLPVLLSVAIAIAIAFIVHLLWGSGTFFGWKLYAFGAVGFIAGLLFQRGRISPNARNMPAYGFFATFTLYGGIMNIAAMVMASTTTATGITVSWKSLGILYISGAPYDAIHALGSAFFLLLLGEVCLNKTERIKIKYGLYEKKEDDTP